MGHPVSVLVDSGSTHDVIQPRVASFLGLPTDTTTSFPVMVGDGNYIQCTGQCPNVTLKLDEANFTILPFILPVAGVDIVLDITWLSSIGPHTADYSFPQITFPHAGKMITLHGDPLVTSVTTSSLCHLFSKQAVAS